MSPLFQDAKAWLLDVTGLWVKSSLPVLSRSKIERKSKMFLEKWKWTLEKAMKTKGELSRENWLKQLFNICKCKCLYAVDNVKLHKCKILCACPFDHRVLSIKMALLLDKINERNINDRLEQR